MRSRRYSLSGKKIYDSLFLADRHTITEITHEHPALEAEVSPLVWHSNSEA